MEALGKRSSGRQKTTLAIHSDLEKMQARIANDMAELMNAEEADNSKTKVLDASIKGLGFLAMVKF